MTKYRPNDQQSFRGLAAFSKRLLFLLHGFDVVDIENQIFSLAPSGAVPVSRMLQRYSKHTQYSFNARSLSGPDLVGGRLGPSQGRNFGLKSGGTKLEAPKSQGLRC